MLVKLNRIEVYCSDMKRSVAFYRDQIGFPVKFQSAEHIEFHSGLTRLILRLASPSGENNRRCEGAQAGDVRFSLTVLDLEQFYREKTATGVKFLLPPTVQDSGTELALLLDPDGLAIAVCEE